MGRKKRRSSKFKDSSTVIDMEEARKERQKERQAKQEKIQARAKKSKKKRNARGESESEPKTVVNSARHDRRKMALRRRKRGRNIVILAVAAVVLILLGFSFGNIIMLKHDLHSAEKEQQAYIEEKEQLQKDLKEIDDLDNLEEQARNQMRLIKPGETLYIFPENMTASPEATGGDGEDTKDKTTE